MRLQSARVLQHYLDELHELGGELSMSQNLMRVTPELAELAERATDRSAARSDEPYRRAIAGIYARLAKTASELDHVSALRRPIHEAPAYSDVAEFAADLTIIAQSLEAHGGAILARGRLRALRRAVDVFGFHLAPLDLRQNSDVHERTVAELFAAAAPGTEYLQLDEDQRIALLRAELRSPRPLVSAVRQIQRGDRERAGDFSRRGRNPAHLWRRRHPHRDHLQDRGRLGHARAGAAAQGGRPHHGAAGAPRSTSFRCSRPSTTCAPA